jgi:WhiB family redox-sensing transcriptional regulator
LTTDRKGFAVRALRIAASWQQVIPLQVTEEADSTWRFSAACADEDPDLFFPSGKSAGARRQTAHAKAICADCPVQAECLEWAKATEQPYGVWGGLDERERATA